MTLYTVIGTGDGHNVDIRAEDVSDGYHTMAELYLHRHALVVALFRAYDSLITPLNCSTICWKSKLHSDGTMFLGWFIVGMTTRQFIGPPTQISYHLPIEYWNRFTCQEVPSAPVYDGHTSKDVIERLLKL